MIRGVGVCFKVIGGEGQHMFWVRVITCIVGNEVHRHLPVLALWVVIPLFQLTLAPPLPGPLIEDVGSYQHLPCRIKRFQCCLRRGGNGKGKTRGRFEGFQVFLGGGCSLILRRQVTGLVLDLYQVASEGPGEFTA